jgi:hypothetical protein
MEEIIHSMNTLVLDWEAPIGSTLTKSESKLWYALRVVWVFRERLKRKLVRRLAWRSKGLKESVVENLQISLFPDYSEDERGAIEKIILFKSIYILWESYFIPVTESSIGLIKECVRERLDDIFKVLATKEWIEAELLTNTSENPKLKNILKQISRRVIAWGRPINKSLHSLRLPI